MLCYIMRDMYYSCHNEATYLHPDSEQVVIFLLYIPLLRICSYHQFIYVLMANRFWEVGKVQ